MVTSAPVRPSGRVSIVIPERYPARPASRRTPSSLTVCGTRRQATMAAAS
jgi:hypothetical protein